MLILKVLYKYFYKREAPYYYEYSLVKVISKPIRKMLNVNIIPAIPFNTLRIIMYRAIGYHIGKNVFIGMKCYLDDIDPKKTVIEDNVTISYGCYFACHGINQEHKKIVVEKGAYIGMRCTIIAGKNGITVGENSIVGAGSLVNRDVLAGVTVAGVPAKIRRKNTRYNI